jgi:hypothetical protein
VATFPTKLNRASDNLPEMTHWLIGSLANLQSLQNGPLAEEYGELNLTFHVGYNISLGKITEN